MISARVRGLLRKERLTKREKKLLARLSRTTRTLYLVANGKSYYIRSITAGSEPAADHKIKALLRQIMTHPAQSQREYEVR